MNHQSLCFKYFVALALINDLLTNLNNSYEEITGSSSSAARWRCLITINKYH